LGFFENFPVFRQLRKRPKCEVPKEIAQKFFFSKKNGPVTVADENSPVGWELNLKLKIFSPIN